MAPLNIILTTVIVLLWLSSILLKPEAVRYWYDQQRLAQVLIILISAAGLCINSRARKKIFKDLSGRNIFLGVFALILALISSYQSEKISIALIDVGIWIGMLTTAMFVYIAFKSNREILTRALSTILIAGLTLYYFKSFVLVVDSWNEWTHENRIQQQLIHGFSNPRFFGQVATLALPLLSIPILAAKHKISRIGGYFLLSLFWFLSIVASSRSSWIASLFTAFVFIFLSKESTKYAYSQFISAGAGALLFGFFHFFTGAFVITRDNDHPANRLNLEPSGRIELWNEAYIKFTQNPWFGIGPTHFANKSPDSSSHPHQFFLQFLSEYGFPFTSIISIFILKLLLTSLLVLKNKNKSPACDSTSHKVAVGELCITAALLSSFLHSLVDGIHVSPASQTFIFLLIGVLLSSRIADDVTPPSITRNSINSFYLIVVLVSFCIYTGYQISVDFMKMDTRTYLYSERFSTLYLHPRIWAQGNIKLD